MGKFVILFVHYPTVNDRFPRYNGFGGKVQPGETPLNAAIRELEVYSLYLNPNTIS